MAIINEIEAPAGVLGKIVRDAIKGKILPENPSAEELREFLNIIRLPVRKVIEKGSEFTQKIDLDRFF